MKEKVLVIIIRKSKDSVIREVVGDKDLEKDEMRFVYKEIERELLRD